MNIPDTDPFGLISLDCIQWVRPPLDFQQLDWINCFDCLGGGGIDKYTFFNNGGGGCSWRVSDSCSHYSHQWWQKSRCWKDKTLWWGSGVGGGHGAGFPYIYTQPVTSHLCSAWWYQRRKQTFWCLTALSCGAAARGQVGGWLAWRSGWG